ncbi:hypothetical protein BY996DRAFT_6451428 [Phakopsora pachyrhizi]|nr:hypothetical protein BY996DRAFT_6451428 [Phakopsora pachyrhizi]
MVLKTNQDMFSGSALSNNDKYTSFAQVVQSVSSDELDYILCYGDRSVNSKLNKPMSLTPDERDYRTLKHNRWQLLMTFKDIGRWRAGKVIRAKPIMTNEQTRQAISRHNSWLKLTIGARGIPTRIPMSNSYEPKNTLVNSRWQA